MSFSKDDKKKKHKGRREKKTLNQNNWGDFGKKMADFVKDYDKKMPENHEKISEKKSRGKKSHNVVRGKKNSVHGEEISRNLDNTLNGMFLVKTPNKNKSSKKIPHYELCNEYGIPKGRIPNGHEGISRNKKEILGKISHNKNKKPNNNYSKNNPQEISLKQEIHPFLFSLYGHLLELHRRLWFCALFFSMNFLLCYMFVDYPMNILVRPLALLLKNLGGRRFIYTNLSEGFVTYLRCSFFSSLILSLPIFVYHIWKFIQPGLKNKEKQHLGYLFFLCPLLFLGGSALAYYWICPMAWSFFLSYDGFSLGGVPLQFEAKISDYVSITLHLMSIFGLGFQLPVVLLLLHGLHIISYRTLEKGRGYALAIITIIAALLTPPDIVSPLGLIVPLYGLYEGTLLWLKYTNRK